MNWELKYYPEYWGGKKLAYPHVPLEHPKLAKSVVVGNLIFLSGCTGLDTITGKPTSSRLADQMKIALDRARIAMENAGSSMNNISKTLFLATSLDIYPEVRRLE